MLGKASVPEERPPAGQVGGAALSRGLALADAGLRVSTRAYPSGACRASAFDCICSFEAVDRRLWNAGL